MERELLDMTLKNAQKELPIRFAYKQARELDGALRLTYNAKTYNFFVEVKTTVRPYLIGQLEQYIQEYQNVILIAERIPAHVKQQLRERKIPYIEANGNMYFEYEDTFLLIDTKKTIQKIRETGNRAFTKTGLKVVFHFLLDPELVNHPQREIAKITGVGLGNIPQVINGLKTTGYLIPVNKSLYTWQKREELLKRWIEDYQTVLRPSLKKRTYNMRTHWQEIQLNDQIATWGGEPAADLITHHLRPEKFILYTNEDPVNLIRNYNLQPKENGELEVIEMFWHLTFNEETAPPLLVYAELILEGGKRNNETAEMIYNEHIKPNL